MPKSNKIIFNQEFGYIHFHSEPIGIMKIRLANVHLAIFEVINPEIIIRFNDFYFEPFRSYSMLTKVENYEADNGALLVNSLFNGTNKFRFISPLNLLNWNFNDTKKQIAARENYSLIYEGQRNEG